MATPTTYRTPTIGQVSPLTPKTPGVVPTPVGLTAPLTPPGTPETGIITHGDAPPSSPLPTTQPPPASSATAPAADGAGPNSALAGALAGYTPTTPNQNTTAGTVNGIDPVAITPTSMAGYQPFMDSAYQQAASRLDPQFQAGEDRFRQDMVNRGITQGSAAYDHAWDDFSRTKNDAYASAQNAAYGQGLAAQGQAFGQGATQAGLAQAMRQWSDQFGLNRDQLDLNAQGQLVGQQMDAYRLNQASNLQQFQLAQALLGMTPGMAPAQIDTYSPYNLQQSAANSRATNQTNQQNGYWGALGQLGSAWLSSREP